MLAWWRGDAADPGRASLHDPHVQRLIGEVAPGAQATDLGGVMSLNVWLHPAGLVLRTHMSLNESAHRDRVARNAEPRLLVA
jgi:hypothetical protein